MRLWHIITFLLLFAAFALALAPASLFVPSQPGTFTYTRSGGTMWAAQFEGARLGETDMGPVRWTAEPAALLTGDAAGQIVLEGPVTGTVRIAVPIARAFGGSGLALSSPSLKVSNAAAFGPAAITLTDVSMRFADGLCAAASGTAKVDLGVRAPGFALTPLTGGVACAGKAARLSLMGAQGGADIAVIADLTADGALTWQALARTSDLAAGAALAANGFAPGESAGVFERRGAGRWAP